MPTPRALDTTTWQRGRRRPTYGTAYNDDAVPGDITAQQRQVVSVQSVEPTMYRPDPPAHTTTTAAMCPSPDAATTNPPVTVNLVTRKPEPPPAAEAADVDAAAEDEDGAAHGAGCHKRQDQLPSNLSTWQRRQSKETPADRPSDNPPTTPTIHAFDVGEDMPKVTVARCMHYVTHVVCQAIIFAVVSTAQTPMYNIRGMGTRPSRECGKLWVMRRDYTLSCRAPFVIDRCAFCAILERFVTACR